MFASMVQKEVVLADGERVVIRKLNHATLDRARDARSSKGARSLRDFGGEIVSVLRSEEFGQLKAKREEDPNAPRLARYNAFDRGIVLVAGIKSWTSSEKLTPEAVEDLDEPSAQKIFEEIVDLSLGPLNQKTVEEQGKGA